MEYYISYSGQVILAEIQELTSSFNDSGNLNDFEFEIHIIGSGLSLNTETHYGYDTLDPNWMNAGFTLEGNLQLLGGIWNTPLALLSNLNLLIPMGQDSNEFSAILFKNRPMFPSYNDKIYVKFTSMHYSK